MGQFVSEDPGDLIPVHVFEQALGDGDHGVLRVSARGKGIWRILRNHKDPGHGKMCSFGQLTNDLLEFRTLSDSDLSGTIHAQDDLVGEPVTEKVHAHGKHKGQDHPLWPTEEASDPDDQRCHETQKQGGFEPVSHI